MRNRRRFWLTTTLIAILGVLALLKLSARGRPVLFEYRESGDPAGHSLYSIFNPFRDRGPEVAARDLLAELRDSKLDHLLDQAELTDERRAEIREKELAYPLRQWDLVQRRDTNSEVTLFFWATRAGYPEGVRSPIWMTMSREAPGLRWKLSKLDMWY